MILYNLVIINLVAFIFDESVLYMGLTFALIYIWCKRNPVETVTFYFGLQVKSILIITRRILPLGSHCL